MGDLLVISRTKSLPAPAFTAGHSAEILFFTGVRYYRMDEPAELAIAKSVSKLGTKRPSATDQRRAKLKRDQRLEALA